MQKYVYRVRKCRNGYAAIVGCVEDGLREHNASYQDGFDCRHKAYRSARSMAKALGRNHAYVN